MEKLINLLKRSFGILLFALCCFCALLYGMGVFNFTFIERDLPISGIDDETDAPPQMSEEDKLLEEQLSHMGVGENLSGVNMGNTTQNGEKDPPDTQNQQGGQPETGDSQGGNDDKTDLPRESYPAFEELDLPQVYVGEYHPEYSIFAELSLDYQYTRDHVRGKKWVLSDSPKIYEEGGEYFYSTDPKEVYRFTYEPYMGYILASDRQNVTVFTNTGRKLGTYTNAELTPAYTRSRDGSALFTDAAGNYLYLDENGEKILSDYHPETDNRGLYFNYSADLGASDNHLQIFCREELVSFVDEIDTSDFYIRSSISPDLAYSIYILRPDYAATVARYNPRFAIALKEAKAKVEADKQRQEEEQQTALTADTEFVSSPETDIVSSPETDIVSSPETELITSQETETVWESSISESETAEETVQEADSDTAFEETDLPETESNSETDTDTDEDTDTDTDTETNTDTDTDTDIDTDTEFETEAGTEVDTESDTESETSFVDPNILVINRELTLPRYGFGIDGSSDIDYKYAKAYAYSEGRAAVVDDRGILRFIDQRGNVVIDGCGTKMVTSSRYITTEYAEPLYRHSENSKGHLYFDSGLVRVRKLERDYTYQNLIYSDSDVLLYPDGSEFPIPHGFSLVAYSEGVLVLKGQNGKYGYYHKSGYWIAQPVYTEIRPFSEGLGVIGFLGGKKGVIDKNGNIVVPFAYEYITAPSAGVITLYDYEIGWRILVKTLK